MYKTKMKERMRELNNSIAKQELGEISSNVLFVRSLLLFGCFIYLEQNLSEQHNCSRCREAMISD